MKGTSKNSPPAPPESCSPVKCSDRPVSNIIPEKESRTLEYRHHRYHRIHSKLSRSPPVTGAAYIGTLQNRTCFKGETGWLRNIICPSLRGADFFYVIGNYSIIFL